MALICRLDVKIRGVLSGGGIYNHCKTFISNDLDIIPLFLFLSRCVIRRSTTGSKGNDATIFNLAISSREVVIYCESNFPIADGFFLPYT